MILEHGDYIGRVDYDPEDDVFHGEVLNLRDVITFEGRSVDELRRAFAESVDDYVAFCREHGKEPQKPFSGRFVVRLDPELHRDAAEVAARQGRSLNTVAKEAIREYVHEHSGVG
jgi:predicted HicB family RNase H-like nuclease